MRTFLGVFTLSSIATQAMANGSVLAPPAPLIGASIPVGLVVGAAFLVSELRRRRR